MNEGLARNKKGDEIKQIKTKNQKQYNTIRVYFIAPSLKTLLSCPLLGASCSNLSHYPHAVQGTPPLVTLVNPPDSLPLAPSAFFYLFFLSIN